MARSKTTKKNRSQKQDSEKKPQEKVKLTRRELVVSYLFKGTLIAAVGGGAVLFAADFRSKVMEQDLSVVGQGTPTIVQIHDPSCSMCAALQSQTRKALRSFSDQQVIYRVANIRTQEGLDWQTKEALPHVTLIFYAANGERLTTIEGVTPKSEIEATIRQVFGF